MFVLMTSSDISPDDMFNLAKRCHVLSVEKDSPILLNGEDGHRFYMMVKGEARVIRFYLVSV